LDCDLLPLVTRRNEVLSPAREILSRRGAFANDRPRFSKVAIHPRKMTGTHERMQVKPAHKTAPRELAEQNTAPTSGLDLATLLGGSRSSSVSSKDQCTCWISNPSPLRTVKRPVEDLTPFGGPSSWRCPRIYSGCCAGARRG